MPARHIVRWTAYAGVSTALAGAVIVKAVAQRPNFYSAAVYLSQSSANLLILTNLVFMLACSVLFALQKTLYGPLRPIEIEQLYERGWFAVTETCLAMTIFRGAIGPWFLAMFFALLVGKVWQWIGEGRVEVVEQQQQQLQLLRNPRLFHTRLAVSLGLGVLFDLSMLEYVVKQVMRMARPDMMVMFGFEFAVLSIMSLSTAARYALALVEISIVREQKRRRAAEMVKERVASAERRIREAETRAAAAAAAREDEHGHDDGEQTPTLDQAREQLRRAQEEPIDDNEVDVEGWEARGRYIFYLDLATDFFKLVIYLFFFFILLVFYGLPLHIMRDVFLTARSFFKRISDFIKYRAATRDMNERFPDATEQDIAQGDVCIICREDMRPAQHQPDQPPPSPLTERMRPKKLPCGHILHFACLRSWLERQQVCPTCRRPVLNGPAPGTAAAADARAGAGGRAGAGAAAGPGGAADANGQAGQGAQGGAGGPGRARVFQFGPLRIGVGAARGNQVLEELQQELQHDGRAAAAEAGEPAAGRNRRQQYGFGIRWDGAPRRSERRRHRATVREQLDRAEQQIQEEMRALAQHTREFAVLRRMQLELDRIRAAGRAVPTNTVPVVPPPPPATIPQRLQVPAGEHHIHAGSPDLPPGMVLPEGWSMVPLRPAQVQAPPIPPAFALPTGIPTTIQTTFAGTAPVPQHIRAMFSDIPVPGQTQPTQPTQQADPSPTLPHDGGHDPAQIVEQVARPQQARHESAVVNLQRIATPDNAARERQPLPPSSAHVPNGGGLAAAAAAAATPSTTTTAPRSGQLNGEGEGQDTAHTIPRRSFGQPSPVTPQPLPAWGFTGYEVPRRQPAEQVPQVPQAPQGPQAQQAQAAGQETGSQEGQPKQATVEDAAEGS